jgi:hypothetical protein
MAKEKSLSHSIGCNKVANFGMFEMSLNQFTALFNRQTRTVTSCDDHFWKCELKTSKHRRQWKCEVKITRDDRFWKCEVKTSKDDTFWKWEVKTYNDDIQWKCEVKIHDIIESPTTIMICEVKIP